jgi:hypothetical protein
MTGTPEEMAGVGHVGDGHVGAEARCPACDGAERTAETDFVGGVVLRCPCGHVERVRRRTAADVDREDAARIGAAVAEGRAMAVDAERPNALAREVWVQAVPETWTAWPEVVAAWGAPVRTCAHRLSVLVQCGWVERERPSRRGVPQPRVRRVRR